MCFWITMQKKVLKAKKDIECFKIVYTRGKYFKSYWQEFIYEKGFHYYNEDFKEEVEKVFNRNQDSLHGQGFHSFTMSNTRINTPLLSTVTRIKCIIPKGAYYLHNPSSHEYISSDLIIVEKYGNRRKKEQVDQGISSL